ncbi:BppU family phage baseplate upper protein [Lactobacillus hominis]|uniref:BppU family phage baseplate upper protein n=1 Tax=Lactobacillus hominis TaxID=1203033 RepID=UPI0023F0B587|nr:BppU family phage baseplate upper protein [Lactobacillus hominis]
MVNNPRLPTLDLDVQKDVRFIVRPFKLTQGDKGYVQPFRLTNAWSQYNISATNLAFHATKPDGTVIEIENEPTRFSQENGVWLFVLPEQVAQAIGNVTCYFSVIDGDNLVASTTKFGYEVSAKFGAEIPSNNYVSALEDMEKQFQDYLANANNQLNKQNQLTNESKQQLTQTLADMSKKTQDWLTAKTAEVDADIKTRQDNLNALNSQYQAKYNELVASWNSKITSIQSDWDARKAEILAQAKDQRDGISSDWDMLKAKFNVDRDTAIRTANDNFQNKLTEIQADWNAEKTKLEKDIADYKTALENKLKPVADKVTDLLENKLPDLNGKADAVQAKVDQLKADFNAIDFSSYAKVSDVYTKQEVDQKVASAGKVKTVDGQQPDASGNIYSTNLVSNGYDIVANRATNAGTMKSNSAWLTGTDALKPFADAINQLQGTGPNRVGTVDLNVLQGITNKVTTYICTSEDNKNTPPFFIDKRGILICFNYDGNAKTQVWIPVGGSGQQPLAYRYWEGNNYGTWKKIANSDELNSVRTLASNNKSAVDALQAKTNVAAPLFRRITTNNNWQDILGVPNSNQILVSIRDDTGGGNTLGGNSAGIAFGGGDTKGVLNVSYSNHTARIIGGNGNAPVWHEDIAWRSDIANVNNRLNELNAKIPDIHAVNSEAEGNAYLASHPNAIIMVKG